MIDQQKLYEALEKLGQKLGVASEHVYSVLITQVKYQAVTRLLLLPIILGLCFGLVYFIRRWAAEDTKDKTFANWIGGIVGVFFAFLILSLVRDSVLQLMNPEYYALKEIFELLK